MRKILYQFWRILLLPIFIVVLVHFLKDITQDILGIPTILDYLGDAKEDLSTFPVYTQFIFSLLGAGSFVAEIFLLVSMPLIMIKQKNSQLEKTILVVLAALFSYFIMATLLDPRFRIRFINTNVVFYGWLALFSYFFYELIRNRIPNRWKYFILSRTFIVLAITLTAGFLVSDSNLKQALFTFSSVYLGFWLNEQVKAQEERRKLKFFLGMIWQELRYNRVQLETLKKNYQFFMDDEKNLEIMYLKLSSINTHAGFLKSTVYDAFVSSSVITGLKKDEIFNDLATAYTNIKFLQSALGIVLSDFEIKLKIHHYSITQNGKDKYVKQILDDLGEKIKNHAGKELAISYRSVCKAIDSTDSYLNSMMVKSDEEKMSDNELVKEDRDFIEGILKPSPQKLPKNLFND